MSLIIVSLLILSVWVGHIIVYAQEQVAIPLKSHVWLDENDTFVFTNHLDHGVVLWVEDYYISYLEVGQQSEEYQILDGKSHIQYKVNNETFLIDIVD